MIDLNIANVITIGLVAMLFWCGLQWGLNAANINIPFLQA